jgi:hypothetical protein
MHDMEVIGGAEDTSNASWTIVTNVIQSMVRSNGSTRQIYGKNMITMCFRMICND